MPNSKFPEFLAVLQSGDRQAVEELLRHLDPFLRRVIRLRLIDGRLRRLVDTADIFQSLLKDFLSRREADRPPAPELGGLSAYLAAAVHHKIQTRMRAARRHAGDLPDGWDPASPEPAAAQHIEEDDLSQAVRARLPEQTRPLFDLKLQGLTWAEIAGRVGGKPDALRMRLTRSVAAVLGELGHEETSHAL